MSIYIQGLNLSLCSIYQDKKKFAQPVLQNGLTRVLTRHRIKLSFKTTNHSVNILKLNNNKTKSGDTFYKCGVNKLTCSDCPSTYIGQTGNNFRTRFKEHQPNP